MRTPLRTIDTMDAKDWIILRLLRVCAAADQRPARHTSDFIRAVNWAAHNLDILDSCGSKDISLALNNDIKRQDDADRYIYAQWSTPDHIDALVPFEALLTSVQTNDA